MTGIAANEITASMEDYLETIFQIIREKSAVRAKDIAKRMKVGRSSVTGALHALADRELINYAPYDVITLTDRGQRVAEDVVRRHEVLRDFFVKVLAVDVEEADSTACRMEHAISETVLERFVEFIEHVERCPEGGLNWVEGKGYRCQHERAMEPCERCVEMESGSVKMAELKADMSLAKLKKGQKATIVRIGGSGSVRRRLMDMGATTGTVIEVERVAPLGDPIEVKIKGYHLTLRKEEAQRIEVNVL